MILINKVPKVLLLFLTFRFRCVRPASKVLLAAMPTVVPFIVQISLFVADLDALLLHEVVLSWTH